MRRPLLALAAIVLMLASACGGGGARTSSTVADGTAVLGADQEPAIINPWLSEGNLQATHTLSLTMLYPLWRVTPDFEYEPLLLEGMPEVRAVVPVHRPRPVGRAPHLRPGRRMYLGHIVEIGERRQIFEKPTHPYTRSLLSAIPISDPAQRGMRERRVLHGDTPSPADPPSGCRFRTRCWKAEDVCAEQEPALVDRFDHSHPSACHFAEPPPGSRP